MMGITFANTTTELGSQGGGFYQWSTYFFGTNGYLYSSPALTTSTERLLSCSVDSGKRLLATLDTSNSTVRVYQLTDISTPVLLASANNTSGTLASNPN